MSYIATINQQTYTIDTGENGSRRSVTLEGQPYTLDWRRVISLITDSKANSNVGGRYSLIINGQSYEIFARRITRPDEKTGQTYEIQIAGQRFEVKVEDERTRKLVDLSRGGAHSGKATIQAPMPGLVLRLPFAPGAQVDAGQTVAVLEAMKMENDLPSPIAGTIKEIPVQPGQTVEQGQALVIVEGEQA